jgi:hypothetical protein
MPDPLWALASLAAASAPLAAHLAWRRRGRSKHGPGQAAAPPRDYHLPPSIEAAESEMAVLLRRMRAFLQDPYDFPASRIADEAAFEDCLDRAATLGARIAELGGAAPAGPAEWERTRGLILDSLMRGRGGPKGGPKGGPWGAPRPDRAAEARQAGAGRLLAQPTVAGLATARCSA